MTKQFRRGLVVGKFAPLHRGHDHLIRTALDRCDRIVVISYSYPLLTSANAGDVQFWLQSLFDGDRMDIITPPLVPHNDDQASVHRDFCLDLLLKHSLTVDAVFTSEDYGDGFAEHLTTAYQRLYGKYSTPVAHVSVDQSRSRFPASGTSIRSSGILTSNMVSPVVKGSFVPRVAILGGESSGKTTLATALVSSLQQDFTVGCVYEYGRELYEQLQERHLPMVHEDMVAIAKEQINRERSLAATLALWSATNRPLLICDTTPLTTQWYSQSWYRNVDPVVAAAGERYYNLTILCDPTIPFDQDGTRVGEQFRQDAHDWYVDQLNARGDDYVVVSGSVEKRLVTAVGAILSRTMKERSWYE